MKTVGASEARARAWVKRLKRNCQLVELRESFGLSQGDVARALGVSQPTVWRWEHTPMLPRGHRAMDLRELLTEAL